MVYSRGSEDGMVRVSGHDIGHRSVCIEKLDYSGSFLVPYIVSNIREEGTNEEDAIVGTRHDVLIV
jgi:hypothetical protein